MQRNEKTIESIFETKRKRRQELARLPIEKKVQILIELQKIASPILQARGLKRTPWRI